MTSYCGYKHKVREIIRYLDEDECISDQVAAEIARGFQSPGYRDPLGGVLFQQFADRISACSSETSTETDSREKYLAWMAGADGMHGASELITVIREKYLASEGEYPARVITHGHGDEVISRVELIALHDHLVYVLASIKTGDVHFDTSLDETEATFCKNEQRHLYLLRKMYVRFYPSEITGIDES